MVAADRNAVGTRVDLYLAFCGVALIVSSTKCGCVGRCRTVVEYHHAVACSALLCGNSNFLLAASELFPQPRTTSSACLRAAASPLFLRNRFFLLACSFLFAIFCAVAASACRHDAYFCANSLHAASSSVCHRAATLFSSFAVILALSGFAGSTALSILCRASLFLTTDPLPSLQLCSATRFPPPL